MNTCNQCHATNGPGAGSIVVWDGLCSRCRWMQEEESSAVKGCVHCGCTQRSDQLCTCMYCGEVELCEGCVQACCAPADKKYMVYMNKTHDVWVSDAHKYLEDKGENMDEWELISQPLFYILLDKGKITPDTPVYFMPKIITKRRRGTVHSYST